MKQLLQAWQRMHQLGRLPWAATGMPKGAFMTLCALEEQEAAGAQDATVSEVAAMHGISKAGASQMLSALEQDGLVERYQGSSDRRLVRVRLTAAGREVVLKAKAALEAVMGCVLSAMGERDAKQLSVLLERFCDLLEATEMQLPQNRKEEHCVDI